MSPQDADRMANSVDPDPTAPSSSGAVGSVSLKEQSGQVLQ